MDLIKKLHLYGTLRRISLFMINYVFRGTSPTACGAKRNLMCVIGCPVGKGTTIVGPIACSGYVKIGENCWIGKNFTINGNGSVEIGDRCDIGPEVTFQTGGHQIGSPERRAGEGIKFHQTVGNGTWIGGRVTVLNEANIGQGCVIAGCACVVDDVEDNTLVGGVPAKVIAMRFTEEEIKKHKKLIKNKNSLD